MTDWRVTASAIYGKPNDGKVFGMADLDLTEVLSFIERKRKDGIKVTLTTFFIAAIAKAMNGIPEMNGFLKRGRFQPRNYVDVHVTVLADDKGNLVSVIVSDAAEKSLAEIVNDFREQTAAHRSGKIKPPKNLLQHLPWPFRRWFFVLARFVVYDLGIELKKLGLHSKRFGSVMLTNVGSVGVDAAFGSLMPAAAIPAIFSLGSVIRKPVAVGDAVEIRPMLAFCATMDHRIVDGAHGGRILFAIRQFVNNPELLESTQL